MNDYELLRVIDFIRQTRAPLAGLPPMADEEPVWNIVSFLISSEIKGQTVTISALTHVTGSPYSTSRRLINRLIKEGHIVRSPRGRTGKTFSLHPSEALKQAFVSYARKIKSLLARTIGMRSSEEADDNYYFGGTPALSQIVPPPGLVKKRTSEKVELKFLLGNDNYFTAMRNMWADFRNNLASRRNFDLCALPDLYRAVLENGRLPVSHYDIVTINIPWLGELVEKGLIRPIGDLLRRTGVDPADFHPAVWSTGIREGKEYGAPIYSTIQILSARQDLFAARGLAFPETFDEVIHAGRTLHNPAKGQFGVVWDGARGMPIASSFMFFMGACGSPIVSLRRDKQSFTLEGTRVDELAPRIVSDAGRGALDYMHRLLAISPPNVLSLAWDTALEVFLTGRAAMAYCWTMRASRFEYDMQSAVRRRVEYLPQPAGPGGSRVSPIGGYILGVPANLPEERVGLAVEAIAWMTSREAMKAHVKNGFPIAPRFSIAADPEAAASSPILRIVDKLARRNLLQTWQRPPLPEYTRIEEVLGQEIHDALTKAKPDLVALKDASDRIERILSGNARAMPRSMMSESSPHAGSPKAKIRSCAKGEGTSR